MATTTTKPNRSGLSDHKTTPSTPRVSKLGRAGRDPTTDSDSSSPCRIPRLSVDRSPSSSDSKPGIVRRPVTTPDRQVRAAAATKGSDLQAQLTAVQEELKKARERLASVERDKACVLRELEGAKKSAEEANERLAEAVAAHKKAEERSVIEKLRADEFETAGNEAGRKREEEWESEIEKARSQQAVDVTALLAMSQELQRVKKELVMTTDAKNTALSHADDAMRIAEINAEKVAVLSGEVVRLKSLLESQLESKSNETRERVAKLNSEIATLKHELEKAKAMEEKLVEMEASVEGLRIGLSDAQKAETNATNLADEFRRKVESLETRLEENNQSEKLLQESHANAKKELELTSSSLSDAESEIASLRRTVEGSELAAAWHKEQLERSNQSLEMAQEGAFEMGKSMEALKSELQEVEEEKRRLLSNEKNLAASFESLFVEKNKLLTELDIRRDEWEKVKAATEGLSLALHQVSTEAMEAKERFLAKQAEAVSAHARVEELESSLRGTKESYEVRVVEAEHEIERVKKTVERSEAEAESSREEWNARELSLVSSIRSSEEEIGSMKAEIGTLVETLKGVEEEVRTAREGGVQLADKLRLAETETSLAMESVEEAKAESLQLKEKLAEKENELLSVARAAMENEAQVLNRVNKAEQEAVSAGRAMGELKADMSLLEERLLDKENELQSITRENDDLRSREAAALGKVEELSALLALATVQKSENAHEFVIEPVEAETVDAVEKPEPEPPTPAKLDESCRDEKNPKEEIDKDKDWSPEREHEAESADDELAPKIDCASLDDHTNGMSSDNVDDGEASPTKQQQQQQKKKKPLLQKFGSLLKKKGNNPK